MNWNVIWVTSQQRAMDRESARGNCWKHIWAALGKMKKIGISFNIHVHFVSIQA